MNNNHEILDRSRLQRIARQAMFERGLAPEFPPAALAEVARLDAGNATPVQSARDLRRLPWCSLDNDDSLDLDQLTVAGEVDGGVKILVAIADVDAFAPRGSAVDAHAGRNTTSVYTAAEIFPMLPEKLSNDLTSLNYAADRLAIIIEMVIAGDGSLRDSAVCRGRVRNHARLAYNSVAAWLTGSGPLPEAVRAVPGLEANLRLQSLTAKKLKARRFQQGALDFETIQAHPVFEGDALKALAPEKSNVAKDIIADFMIAANGVTARYLAAKNFPSIRRIVREPKRWERIVLLAAERGAKLPAAPDSKALEDFLLAEKTADPVRFPDLSLSVIKLLGKGEYMIEIPGEKSSGHFGLAVKDYAHSTAPNRRFPDLVTQRLLKAAMDGRAIPYRREELQALAGHCTQKEDDARKVERLVEKAAAAMLLETRTGEVFEAIVTGAAAKGTWVRLLNPPVEGRLVSGTQGVDVGDAVRARLLRTDVERGFIDLERM